jgi:hypothetical protein
VLLALIGIELDGTRGRKRRPEPGQDSEAGE